MATLTRSQSIENLDIECPICREYYNRPRFLRCYHSFCTICLQMLLESQGNRNLITCPLRCEQRTLVPDAGISTLPLDHFKCRIVESLLEGENANDEENCEIHVDQKLKYFCCDCKDVICAECCLDVHASHRAERMEDSLVSKLSDELKDVLSKYQSNRDKIYRLAVRSTEKYISVETEQKKFIEGKIDQLESQLVDLKSSLKRTNEGIEKEQARLSIIEEAIDDCIALSQDAVADQSSPHRFLLKYSQAMKCHAMVAQREDLTDDIEEESTVAVVNEGCKGRRRGNTTWIWYSTISILILLAILVFLCRLDILEYETNPNGEGVELEDEFDEDVDEYVDEDCGFPNATETFTEKLYQTLANYF